MPTKQIKTLPAGSIEKTGNVSANETRLTKQDIENAKIEGQIRKIKRQNNLTAFSEYLGFGVSKIVGTLGLVIGGIEWLDAGILPLELKNPAIFAGIGLALLTGKSILSLIAKVEKTFGEGK